MTEDKKGIPPFVIITAVALAVAVFKSKMIQRLIERIRK